MPEVKIFLWEGLNKEGAKAHGEIQAGAPIEVKAELVRQGITQIKIKEQPKLKLTIRQKKISAKDITLIFRQLATLLPAGIPLMQALDTISEGQEKMGVKDMLLNVRKSVEEGHTLADSLLRYEKHFSKLVCSLIRVGEQSGTLDTILNQVAIYKEKSESIKHKIKQALFYPTTVIVVALVISVGLLIFVVPQFEALFKNFGAELPAFTQLVIGMSHFFQRYWWLFLGFVGIIIWLVIKAQQRFENFAYFLDKLTLKLLIVGPIIQEAIYARIARTLSITIAAGLPLIEALNSVASVAGNRVYSKAILRIREEILTGRKMNQVMRNTGIFPFMMVQMVAVGEETGKMDTMLLKAALYYEEEVDGAISGLSSILEPIIMVILGVIIGCFVAAIYLPIFKIGTAI